MVCLLLNLVVDILAHCDQCEPRQEVGHHTDSWDVDGQEHRSVQDPQVQVRGGKSNLSNPEQGK